VPAVHAAAAVARTALVDGDDVGVARAWRGARRAVRRRRRVDDHREGAGGGCSGIVGRGGRDHVLRGSRESVEGDGVVGGGAVADYDLGGAMGGVHGGAAADVGYGPGGLGVVVVFGD